MYKIISWMRDSILGGALLAIALSPAATAQPPKTCKQINARMMTVAFSDFPCASPISFCAGGVITGDGLIHGNTVATVLGMAPVTPGGSPEPESTVSYVGDRVIETTHGDATLRFTGVFDTARGEFSELSRVVEGTGRFENATGTVYITGRSNEPGNEFIGDIKGLICYDPGADE